MAEPVALEFSDGGGSVPFEVVLAPGQNIEIESVTAKWDGSGAAGSFLACLAMYSQDGRLLSRTFPSQIFAAGDVGVVTYIPFLGGGADAGGVTSTALDRVAFEPVAGFIPITSSDGAHPTDIIEAAPLTFDGVTLIRIEFYAAGIDIDQRGKAVAGAALLELWEDGVAVGIMGDWNASAGIYQEMACYTSTFLVPAAGTHTYAVRAYLQPGGGGSGPSNIYGSSLTTPHATRAGFMLITAYVIAA